MLVAVAVRRLITQATVLAVRVVVVLAEIQLAVLARQEQPIVVVVVAVQVAQAVQTAVVQAVAA